MPNDDLEVGVENVLDSLPRALVVLEDHKIIFANNMVQTIFGWKPKELLGKGIEMLCRNQAEFEQIDGNLYPKLEKEASYSEVYPCRHKDGRDRVCNIDISRVIDEWEKKRVVLMYEDITEKLEAEKELQESEEQYRDFVENTHEIVQSIALNGNFLSVNNAWHKSFDYSDDDLKELNLFKIVTEDFRPHLEEVFKKALSGEPILDKEIHFVTKDKRTVILEGNLIPRAFYGKVINVRCFFNDVTENRRIQEEINKKVKELEIFNNLMIDRELKMIELKEKIHGMEEEISALKSQNHSPS